MVERWFLDTQQWNYLTERPGHAAEQLTEIRAALGERARRGAVTVVASATLLQEIMGAKRQYAKKYRAMADFVFATAGGHWLRPLNERHVIEARERGAIGEPNCYLPRQTRRELERMAKRAADIEWVADETRRQVDSFKEEQENIRTRIFSELAEATGVTERDAPRLVRAWWDQVDVGEWVRDIAAAGVERGALSALPEEGPLRECMPSAWHFTAFKLARIRLNLGEGRAVKPSDYMDAEHYAVAPYVDVLFTDDRPFRETCELLRDCPCAVDDFNGLTARLGVAP